jgi:hypothetical protein
MFKLAGILLFNAQKLLLLASYWLYKPFVKPENDLWVVGVHEIANNTHNISKIFDRHYSVNFSSNKYYLQNKYDFSIKKPRFVNEHVLHFLIGPVLLGYLANRAANFFYIGNMGFLFHLADGREFEFSFLKKRGKKIVTFFCGTDIRSLILSLEHAKQHGIDVMATYQSMTSPKLIAPGYEAYLKKLAASADTHADHIFNAPVDQIAYIKRDVHPFVYFYPDERFVKNESKFVNPKKIKIVHAPSSPFIKGTQIVRAAIKKLQVMGYDFDYVEIIGMPNTVVLEHLKESHIVINELYAFVPGLFSVEAMAAHCAVITSADRNLEPTLPEGANEAWFVTKYWEMFDHLKLLLDQPELIKKYADSGYEWAYKNCRTSQSRQAVRQLLEHAA